MICTLVQLVTKDGSGNLTVYRLSNAPFDVVLEGQTYTAAGHTLSIGENEEGSEIFKTGIDINLNGLDPSLRSEIDLSGFVKAPIDVLIANVPDGTNVASSYSYYHRGFCDSPIYQVDSESGTLSISISTENAFTDLDLRPSLLRCSQASHSSRHNGDKFFEYCADALIVDEYWKT